MKLQCPECKNELDVEVVGLESKRTIFDDIVDASKAYDRAQINAGRSLEEVLAEKRQLTLGRIRSLDLQLLPRELVGDDRYEQVIKGGSRVWHGQPLFGMIVHILPVEDKDNWDTLAISARRETE
jgi:hypothetical protein